MVRQRKTKDEWHIEVNYGSGWECECVESSRREGMEQLRTYRANCQYPVWMRKRRVKLGEVVTDCRFVRTGRDGKIGYQLRIIGTVDGVSVDDRYWLNADCHLLADAHYSVRWAEGNPVALLVLLDRMEEFPSEIEGASSTLVAAVVAFCRRWVSEAGEHCVVS